MGVYVGKPKTNPLWKFIPNTAEEIRKAIEDGYVVKSYHLVALFLERPQNTRNSFF
jgi:hypothetical protein